MTGNAVVLATLRSLAPPRRVEIGDRLRLSPQPLDKSEEATLAEATDGLTIHDGVENMATDQAKRMSMKTGGRPRWAVSL